MDELDSGSRKTALDSTEKMILMFGGIKGVDFALAERSFPDLNLKHMESFRLCNASEAFCNKPRVFRTHIN